MGTAAHPGAARAAPESVRAPNGAAMAAFVAAGIGSCALGVIVLLHAAGALSVPAFYAPGGGVTGRTTVAVLVWLLAWGVLHRRWKTRDVDPRRALTITLVLVAAGLAATFPPLWRLFG